MAENTQKPEPFVVGATHRSSSVGLRDRLFVDDDAAPALFERLAEAGIPQALVLSTCDRVEIQGMAASPSAAIETARLILAARAGQEVAEIAGMLECLTGELAVRRIFAVAASLESQVIGEPQVLGQVKEGHRLAERYGMVGPELESLLQSAYGAAKRVRNETPIAERPVSLAACAVQTARDLHGDLGRCGGLIVGLGDMGDLIGGQLRLAGLGRTVLTGPSRRVEAEARRSGHHFAPFDSLDDALAEADIVVTASGAGGVLISAAAVERALKRRRRRPILLIDGGAPGDVDPAVDRLDGAFLYTLDDLERIAHEGRATREEASSAAWEIVDAEAAAWRRSRV
ncbi:MAG: glutamyl-tRNA reductase, partial [Alphaproteobacteria bacterium]